MQLCDFGCGQEAKFYSKHSKKWRCSENVSHCPAIRKTIQNHAKLGIQNEKRYTCPTCGKQLRRADYNKHIPVCGKYKPVIQEEWKQPNGKYKCPYCDKEFVAKGIGTHIWMKHTEAGQTFLKTPAKRKGNRQKGRIPWNKGFTKTTDARLHALSKQLKDKYRSGVLKPNVVCHTDETKKHLSHVMKKYGGYRPGSGHGKKGWYKGYWCDSSWELAYVIYNIDHNIKFTRNWEKFPYVYKGKQHNWVPDFIQDGVYIEIKGYLRPGDIEKHKAFPQQLWVLMEHDLQAVFEYVHNTYGKDFVKLYDV